jgi:hypothetical protein
MTVSDCRRHSAKAAAAPTTTADSLLWQNTLSTAPLVWTLLLLPLESLASFPPIWIRILFFLKFFAEIKRNSFRNFVNGNFYFREFLCQTAISVLIVFITPFNFYFFSPVSGGWTEKIST